LLKANHKDNKFEGKIIPRGSLATSYDSIAQDLKLSREQIRLSIKKLKASQELVTKRTPRYLLVTLVKYNDYQGRDAKNNTQRPLKDHSNTTQITLNNNGNNDNNDNNLIEIERVKEICLSNIKWVEAVKRNFLLNDIKFKNFIENFTNHASVNGYTHISEKEYKQYFIRWYKKSTGKGMNGKQMYQYKKPAL